MPLLHEGYDIGRAFGLVPVACVMCSIREYVGPLTCTTTRRADMLTLTNSALDCEYCDGSMVRMVPPGWTADDAKGFIKITGNQNKIYNHVNGDS